MVRQAGHERFEQGGARGVRLKRLRCRPCSVLLAPCLLPAPGLALARTRRESLLLLRNDNGPGLQRGHDEVRVLLLGEVVGHHHAGVHPPQ
eukprot:6741102-Alexandrium_andersonii.AAC.1